MDFFTSPDLWIAFLTLFVLELVLGVDNVVFISILASKLPKEQQKRARNLGLSLAMFMRIGLLFAASWIIGLTEPLFGFGDGAWQFSGRDLILILGGAFLVYKAVTEIHERLEGSEHRASGGGKAATFGAVIVQILLLDIVFSLDSVITAVGMVDELYIMIAAVVLAIGIMLFTAGIISAFVEKHPTVKMLALAFLVLIGSTLIAEGFDVHIDKALIYGPIAFAIIVEVLNLAYKSRQAKARHEILEPVHLRAQYVADGADAPGGSGALGAAGAAGAAGGAGDVGAADASGVAGAAGAPGVGGAPGTSGVAGASGDVGAEGGPGVGGAPGASGAAGAGGAADRADVPDPTSGSAGPERQPRG